MAFSIKKIQKFCFFKPVFSTDVESIYFKNEDSCLKNINETNSTYYHLPIILDGDFLPWLEGNFFLLKLLKLGRSEKTLIAYAKTLKLFMNFCSDQDIDYLVCQSRLRSPIARYRRFLEDRIISKEIKPSYMKEVLSKIVNFYRFLEKDKFISFDYCPWWEDTENLAFIKKGHITIAKKVKSSEIQKVRGASRKSSELVTYEGRINDSGESLRPLDQAEFEIVFKALREISNIEMTLVHKIIFTSGARTQSILTLRQSNFKEDLDQNQNEIIISAGEGHLVDSKNGRAFYIRLPSHIYKQIQIYIKSERAQKRYSKAKSIYENNKDQYVFISQQGNPFYISKNDLNRFNYNSPPEGQALTVFINSILKPKMETLGFNNSKKRFKFHDLRATYGLLRLESLLKLMPKELPEDERGSFVDHAISLTQKYMNHSSRETTLHYLNLRKNTTLIENANKAWSKNLENIVRNTFDV